VGTAHVVVALLAFVCGITSMFVLSRVPQSLWRSSATTGIRAPFSPLSPLLAGGGLSLWWGDERVFSRVYGVGSRGHRCILVTAVTLMTRTTGRA
jgi:hypothetical protein